MTLDSNIEQLIDCFETKLWQTNNCKFYGRVDRSETVEGYTVRIQPLFWEDAYNSIEVLKDDKYDATCFFDVMPVRRMFSDICQADVRVCFMVNLHEIYPGIARQDATEKAINEVKDLIGNFPFEFIQQVSGQLAFADYGWNESTAADMHPHYLFRFDLKIEYI